MKSRCLVALVVLFPMAAIAETAVVPRGAASGAPPKPVCERVLTTGSHLPRADCLTAEERAQRAKLASSASMSSAAGGGRKSDVKPQIP